MPSARILHGTVVRQTGNLMVRAFRRPHLLLDGGTGEELLAHRDVPDDRQTWSAKAVSDPAFHATLRTVHVDFLKAGSDCVTVNNFGITPGVFGEDEASLNRIKHLTRRAGEIAREAADSVSRDLKKVQKKVLASLPPLVESYRPDLAMSDHAASVGLYRSLVIEVLDDLVDGWIAETLSSSSEVIDAMDAVTGFVSSRECKEPRDLFVSMCVKRGGVVRSGESASSAVMEIIRHWIETGSMNTQVRLRAVLFNCSMPEDIDAALLDVHRHDELLELLDTHHVQLGCYPNRLTEIREDWTMEDSTAPQTTRTDFDEDEFVAWVRSVTTTYDRVQVVGGCCGIGPSHIRALSGISTASEPVRAPERG